MDLGLAVLSALGKYAFTVILGLLIHAAVTLPLLVLFFGRYSRFAWLEHSLLLS
jgi:Na+/H+-dicarboxylate symporter